MFRYMLHTPGGDDLGKRHVERSPAAERRSRYLARPVVALELGPAEFAGCV
jgi:hypothetical protein